MLPLTKVTILVPLYNEVAVLPKLFDRLIQLSNNINIPVHYLLIDDGSIDETASNISNYIIDKPNWSALFLSRNFGHSIAITAGLAAIEKDTSAVFIIDGDLQDPPELLPLFIQTMQQGNDVVYGIRNKRKESTFKKICYKVYYRLLKKFSNTQMPLDAGDFCLISNRVVRQLNSMPEESRYLRGMRSWVGFKQQGIKYERAARLSGKSKYSFTNLFKLAFNGLFNFSELPIRIIGIVGMLAIIPSFIYLFITLYKKLVFGTVPEGFTALIFAIVLFSGVQLLSLGIIGEYVLRIFFQVKQRPLFIIKSKIIKGQLIDE
jgi:polyisoprenyl-phosphate glycosyltransferase